ncbi:acyltransferase family protein [Micromonospora mirobrigensis]|uniref:Peptidoglycan/LPS O-acetylase OafA/YrhL, contains acyltransferase and SGNH-hydrolase domains n=1 Tax=Micromonospora mirobrigensis TaxID=262898 RepID=A0A1C4WHT3_9ACTN|nr:acyltransferase family protein [Micromonospora mirobrigensis]SCE95762.1 Peptidoglycan/LPS O-acetylase OafA/YrhL, contains acyltransferase and SGNH-hydrolase domains [Micromonospora mirobrigensis]
MRLGIAPEQSAKAAFRGDIEGLRALAVLMVVIGHAARDVVPGGFVGVDVFFVISGFLITGLLIAELERTGRISLTSFYARRAKRLLPAAAIVLVASLLLTWLLLPRSRWADTAWDVVASAGYGLNWRLAVQSTDYWAADAAPSIVQHFWSLSVEEQFYLFWPLLLLALAILAGRRRLRRGALMIGFALVALPSFAWSVHESLANPGPAYFVTTTRLWELALGGAVAIVGARAHRLPRALAAGLAWAGLAMVASSAVLVDPQRAFPGYQALLPTVGTAAVIAGAQAAGRAGPAGALGWGPVRAVGAVSYSLYLWHWPLLLAAEARFGELSVPAGLAVVTLSAVPAVLTYRFVENPIRTSEALRSEPAKALRVGAVCTSAALAAGLLFQLTVWPPRQAPPPPVALAPIGDTATATATARAIVLSGPPGAAVLGRKPLGDRAGAAVDRASAITPDPSVAKKDGPEYWAHPCAASERDGELFPCEFGDGNGSVSVALAGDSHMTQWLPALKLIAEAEGWQLRSYARSACPFISIEVAWQDRPEPGCLSWNRLVQKELTEVDKPDLLLVTNTFYRPSGVAPDAVDQANRGMADGLRATWRKVAQAGTPVAVIRDSPHLKRDAAECAAVNPRKLTRCATDRESALSTGGGGVAHELAAKGLSDVHLIDLNDAICPVDPCAAVIGGALVYRDSNHLTATYAASLAPRLRDSLTRLLN